MLLIIQTVFNSLLSTLSFVEYDPTILARLLVWSGLELFSHKVHENYLVNQVAVAAPPVQ